MNKIWYDTEFVEDGRTIRLLSIGMVREDGTKYYAISGDPRTISDAVDHEWLRKHVIPHLPVRPIPAEHGWDWKWINDHPDIQRVLPKWLIADQVRSFIRGAGPAVQMRAWYGSYDHVALMWLWGQMIKKPDGVPMWTWDLKQEAERLGNPQLPPQPAGEEHHALNDAIWTRDADRWLSDFEHKLLEQWAR